MVTHWESSRRPLFVKTVWRDGHHHVLLENEPPLSDSLKSDEHKRRTARRSTKSAVPASVPQTHLNVTPIKLILSGVAGFQQVKRCKTSSVPVNTWQIVNVVPSEAVKVQELTFESPVQKGTEIVEDLSDRVMNWLGQNGKNVKLTHPCNKVVREEIVLKKIANNTVEHATVSPTTVRPLKEENKEEIVGRLEANYDEPAVNKCARNRFVTNRRQLHIFMPILAKKFSDNGSSKSSSMR